MNERVHQWLAALALAMIAALYLATAARPVLGGDNGEFASLMVQGGVAHPTGYPLYTLYLRAMSWLPVESASHAAALATAGLGVLAVAAMRWACRAWGCSRQSATLAASLIGVTGLMWKLSTHAEVFALHALLAACIVGVCGPHGVESHRRRAFLLGLLAGLGLCNNHSIVTLAPLGLYAAWFAVAWARRRAVALVAGLLGLVLGLTPYLYLYLAPSGRRPALVWGRTNELAGLIRHFLRADYGTTRLAISDAGLDPVGHVSRLAFHLATELVYVPAAFALVGLGYLVTRRRTRPAPLRPRVPSQSADVPLPLHRRQVRGSVVARTTSSVTSARPVPPGAGRVYALTFLLAGPVFVSRFNLPLEGLSLVIVERFYLLPLVLLAVPLATGLDRLLGGRLGSAEVQGPLLVGVLCLSIFVAYDDVREHHRPDVERYLENTLRTAEPQGVILGTGDHRLYGFWYVQTVLGVRPDVLYVDPVMLAYPWYRQEIQRTLGAPLDGVDGTSVDTVELAAGVMRKGRAVYLTNRFSEAITQAFATYPIGTLIRVSPPGRPVPRPEVLETMNLELAIDYRYADSDPVDPNGWAAYVQRAYTRPWQVLAETYEAMGRPADAERCRSRHVLVPLSPL